MNCEIKKINSIKNMAVFQNFNWDSSVRDKGNNTAEFKKINILYGRNYSGKTTLSRILRSLEIGSISDKYDSPEFQLFFDDGVIVTQNTLNTHGQIIRVFNKDFIKDNLHFVIDEEQDINSFAILGKDNTKIEEEIRKREIELGSEQDKINLLGRLFDAKEKFNKDKTSYQNRVSNLEIKLRDKANSEIKHNKTFGDANYNLPKIKTDISQIITKPYIPLNDEQVANYYALLKEEAQKEIPESDPFDLKYSIIKSKAKELIEQKIQVSTPIQELVNNTVLAEWVRTGRDQHKDKRRKCAFCGNELSKDLWEKLDKHFNLEYEELRSSLNKLLTEINNEKERVPNILKINSSEFYSNYSNDANELKKQLASHLMAYCSSLDLIKEQIKTRKNDIFIPLSFNEPVSLEDDLKATRNSFEQLRNTSNMLTLSLSDEQKKAREALRLHEVHKFVADIKYSEECENIKALRAQMDVSEENYNNLEEEIKNKRVEINHLKSQLKDESKGAEQVNKYLNDFFGHQFLSLETIEESSKDSLAGFRFNVTRNGKKAFNLSEGESSLIAFCYFMAKLEDIETKGNQPIIWIDDPISSLDANHIFFVYGIINAKIATTEKYEENGIYKERDRFKQLFISTHNLDFFKYLKRLPGARNKKISEYFIINRTGKTSSIHLMPHYLKSYVTEFNFLFHQIYKCAYAKDGCDSDYDCYYNFGNNARKFLEAFLYYKYPNAKEEDNSNKLLRFFGDDVLASSLTDRVNNELSHLEGLFERSVSPLDIPEIKNVAKFILSKMKNNDPDQYSALLESIGEKCYE